MRPRALIYIILAVCVAGMVVLLYACSPPKSEPVKTVTIADGELDPAKWGQAYPLEYDQWKKTKDPKPVGKSKYKKGYDKDLVIYDKLSEFPYLALLYHGWGFGIEYNESRGHHYMVIDQLEIDPSRTAAGGVCLSCKTPYAAVLEKQLGPEYFKMKYIDAHAKIPKEFQELGVACIECHDNKTMGLRLYHPAALESFKFIGQDPAKMTRQELRSAACGQCHVTYIVPRDKDMKPVGLFFPWQGSKPGDISVENIIKVMRKDPSVIKTELGHNEWKQAVTGYPVAYIRHPEYEFYTRNSTHWNAGVACADCHMPYTRDGAAKFSTHDVRSPLLNAEVACGQCHTDVEYVTNRVSIIQNQVHGTLIATEDALVAAILAIESAAAAEGVDSTLIGEARQLHRAAQLRWDFVAAENSMGFHNPEEALRILAAATDLARQAQLKAVLAGGTPPVVQTGSN